MPKRPATHVTGDLATTAVAALFERAGHAVERVARDYGEDLLVQTANAGQMDASRIWIQVKGTADARRLELSTGEHRINVPVEQVLRWTRSADPVLVVLWDLENDVGWYAYPEQVDSLDLHQHKTVTLRFQTESVLDDLAVTNIVWNSRVDHFTDLIVRAQSALKEANRNRQADTNEPTPQQSILIFISLDFLLLFEVIDYEAGGFAVNPSVRETFLIVLGRLFKNSAEKERPSEEQDMATAILEASASISAACIVAITEQAYRYTQGAQIGFSMPLLLVCAETLSTMLDGGGEVGDLFEELGSREDC